MGAKWLAECKGLWTVEAGGEPSCGRFWTTKVERSLSGRLHGTCSKCGASARLIGELDARTGRGACNAACKASEEIKCRCSCGGANHGEALVSVGSEVGS